MRFNLLSDANWESKVDKVLDSLSDFGYRDFFEQRNYGKSLDGITVILMCKNPKSNFKQRIRCSQKEKRLYLDIMLDLNEFTHIEQADREKIVARKLVTDLPPIIAKYKFPDFDLTRFESDLRDLLKNINWF